MKSTKTRKNALKILVLVAILFTAAITVISIQNHNQNTTPLINQTLLPYMNSPANQAVLTKADETWDDTIISNTTIKQNMEIILNGNLIIVDGGSLTLTNVTLKVQCTYNGEHHIEVQSGGALYINDTDGNPGTRSDASNTTALNPSYKYLFWVLSGAMFQMNNSELHYCGYDSANENYKGLWINTNNTIIENNIITNNFNGIILYYTHHNIIKGNNVTNSSLGFILYGGSNNTITGNTAKQAGYGFYLVSQLQEDHNNFTDNTAIENSIGFFLYGAGNNTFTNNLAENNSNGFYLENAIYNTFVNNTATNNTQGFNIHGGCNNFTYNFAQNNDYGFYLAEGSSDNILEGNTATNNDFCGFYLKAKNNRLISNNVTNNGVYGFYLIGEYNTLIGNIATNNTKYGFCLAAGCSNNNVTGNTVTESESGFYVSHGGTSNNLITRNIVKNSSYGFHIFQTLSNVNYLQNNTAINCQYGFYLENASYNNLQSNNVINSTIQAYYLNEYSLGNDLTGSVAANYLRVEVLDRNGIPVQGAEVKVEVDGNTVYASPGFGGSNPTTDENGLTEWISIAFQTYIGGTCVNNTINVTVGYDGLYFIDNPRIVNMSTSHTETFIEDGVPPTVSITSPNEGDLIPTDDVMVTWTGDDNVGLDHYEVKLDDGSWFNVGTSDHYTFPGLSDELHTVQVRVFDFSGNNATDSMSFTVDTVNPTTTIVLPINGAVLNTSDVEVTWSGDDNLGIEHYEVMLDDGSWSDVGTSISHILSNVSTGLHTVQVRVFDLTGNNATDSVSFIVDTSASTVTITVTAGSNQSVNASQYTGVELLLNLTDPILLCISRTPNNLGGSAPTSLNFLGQFYSIVVNDTSAIEGLTITINYDGQLVAELGIDENSLKMYYWNETSGSWVELPSTVEIENNILTVSMSHLTVFTVMGSPIPSSTSMLMLLLLLFIQPTGMSPLIYVAMIAVGAGVVAAVVFYYFRFRRV